MIICLSVVQCFGLRYLSALCRTARILGPRHTSGSFYRSPSNVYDRGSAASQQARTASPSPSTRTWSRLVEP
ncbi:hypothetical protein GGR56DRAFT_639493 [Xylariaceae sp. FL0804]|nr:hypothetical protein GGR56DRAFT_639493 [Xylariaceae sp. FL0804]